MPGPDQDLDTQPRITPWLLLSLPAQMYTQWGGDVAEALIVVMRGCRGAPGPGEHGWVRGTSEPGTPGAETGAWEQVRLGQVGVLLTKGRSSQQKCFFLS